MKKEVQRLCKSLQTKFKNIGMYDRREFFRLFDFNNQPLIFTNETIDSCFHGNDNPPVIIFLQIRTIGKIPQASCLSYNSVRVYQCYQWLNSFFFVFLSVVILPNKIIDSRFHGNDNHFFSQE